MVVPADYIKAVGAPSDARIGSASETGCKILYSEDPRHDQRIHGLIIQNPFL